MYPKKVEAIILWEVLDIVRVVRCFLGFAYFYVLFMKNYSEIVAPLTRLTCKDKLH